MSVIAEHTRVRTTEPIAYSRRIDKAATVAPAGVEGVVAASWGDEAPATFAVIVDMPGDPTDGERLPELVAAQVEAVPA